MSLPFENYIEEKRKFKGVRAEEKRVFRFLFFFRRLQVFLQAVAIYFE